MKQNRNRNVVRLTESKLEQIVNESVKRVLKESARRGIDVNGRPTHYATQDDEKIDYAMEQCANSALEFILDKRSKAANGWFKEFYDKCSHDKLFNTLDEEQVFDCWRKGIRAANSCVYKGNNVQLGRIPTHYEGEWYD